jgi:hypothetical protein
LKDPIVSDNIPEAFCGQPLDDAARTRSVIIKNKQGDKRKIGTYWAPPSNHIECIGQLGQKVNVVGRLGGYRSRAPGTKGIC